MDLLKREMERKRKAINIAKNESKITSNSKGKRAYLRAGDLKRIQEEQAEVFSNKNTRRKDEVADRKRRRKDGGKDDKHAESPSSNKAVDFASQKKSSQVESSGRKDRNKKSDISLEGSDGSDKNQNSTLKMSTSEITHALREFGIPVWLFGEKDDAQRMLRLQEARDSKKSLMAGISENDDFKLGSGHGIRNPFLGGKKDKEEDQDLDQGLKKSFAKEESQIEEVDDESDPHRAVHRFLKSQLKQWEEDLVNRPESIKRTLAGKNETKTLKQCKDYIRPLFKQCKNRRLEESMMTHLVKIVKFCKEGEFVKANDAYIDVAIGRAAWPIGVTMVGIHARSGRAKIESSNVAHVMNSEMQR